MAIPQTFSVEQAKQEAAEELHHERMAAAKTKLKNKLKEIEAAETILANLNREFEDLERELEVGI